MLAIIQLCAFSLLQKTVQIRDKLFLYTDPVCESFGSETCIRTHRGIRWGTMRPKARWLAQHGGPPGWLEGCDLAGVILYVMDGPCRLPFPYRTGCPDGSCPAVCWWNFQPCCYIVNVHNHPSWAKSRKEGMAWYSSRPMPSLCWGFLYMYYFSLVGPPDRDTGI